MRPKIFSPKKLIVYYSPRVWKPNDFVLTSKLKKSFIKKGFFNGKVLVCSNYYFNKGNLILNCQKANFFDMLFKGMKKDSFPKLISVNAIINVEDSVLIIKRPKSVYYLSGYWDFPAGLISSNNSFRGRLMNRIKEDTKLTSKLLHINKRPKFISVTNFSFNLFYEATYKKTQKNSKNSSSLKILKKIDINGFLKKNKFVSPEIFKLLNP